MTSAGQRRTVALVACAKLKRPGEHQARDLYQSQLFRGARRFAEQRADAWWILSAAYGLVAPSQLVACYDQTLQELSPAERRAWADCVSDQLARELRDGDRVVVLAGRLYRDQLVRQLVTRGHQVDVPLAGLGIGRQLQFLKAAQLATT